MSKPTETPVFDGVTIKLAWDPTKVAEPKFDPAKEWEIALALIELKIEDRALIAQKRIELMTPIEICQAIEGLSEGFIKMASAISAGFNAFSQAITNSLVKQAEELSKYDNK